MRRLVLCLLLFGCAPPAPERAAVAVPGRESLLVTDVLGGEGQLGDGWLRAQGSRTFSFPADHGPHPGYRSEWWYLTASLDDAQGRPWGVQFTVFRQQLAPGVDAGTGTGTGTGTGAAGHSAWRSNQFWLAHVGVTSPDGHLASERLARGGQGLAGAQASPFRVWVDGWQMVAAGDTTLPLRLQVPAAAGVPGLDLQVLPGKPLVLQGQDGLSVKGRSPGNASWYYAFTRLPVRGVISLPGQPPVAVSGSGWIDREWSTSALEQGLQGWDWFALQLADGRDLMLYQLRRSDGSIDPLSAGALVAADGSRTALAADEVLLTPIQVWQGPAGGLWPVAWRLQVPGQQIDVQVTAVRQDQLMRTAVRYWEGRVAVTGSHRGVGYLEMTGR